MGQEAVEQVPMVYLVLTGLVFLGLLVPWSKKRWEFMKKIACSLEIRCLGHVETMTEKVYAMARCCRSRSKSKGPWRDSFSRFGEVSINGGLLSKIGIHDDILWNSNPPLVEAFQPPVYLAWEVIFFFRVHQDLNCRQVRKGPLSGTIRHQGVFQMKWFCLAVR